ncbi:MAG: hypothetical protein KTR18_16215 [Acidiferrobacterales bacterium]|nr:hypothetical protein [Acidiferrobacterales bacterium]
MILKPIQLIKIVRKIDLKMRAVLIVFAVFPLFTAAVAQTDAGRLVPILYYLLLEQESDRCLRAIEVGGDKSDVLTTDCEVGELSETYFTRFYSFTLEEDSEVVIEVTPNSTPGGYEPHLVLREGTGTEGEELFFAEAVTNSWRIEADLVASEFTIEVSSLDERILDSYTLSVGKLIR